MPDDIKAPDEFTASYVAAALWSSTDDDGEPLDNRFTADDISTNTLAAMWRDCDAFYAANRDAIEHDDAPSASDGMGSAGQAGHDFWLTRCGHGAGFWDGDWPEPMATQLDNAAKAFGNVDLYIGDDGMIWGI